MTTETHVDDQGRVIARRVRPDAKREIRAVEVVSLSPPTVFDHEVGREFPVGARSVGLTVAVGDWVSAFRTQRVGVVVLSKLEVL